MTPEERLWSRVSENRGCWEWMGSTSSAGYGQISIAGVVTYTHRYAYTLMVGAIPDGLQLDHLCRNRRCLNPEHLDPVPSGVNTLRGNSGSAENARRTHCIRGHAFTAENTYRTSTGRRQCRTCQQMRRRRAYLRSRAA